MTTQQKTIGRYTILRELGQGGMCRVFVGHDPRSKRDVAIKVLPVELAHDPSFRARFEREARAVALLEHPVIVPVYDYGEAEGHAYLVMRLMKGGSLADRIAQGPMELAEVARIFAILAPGLDEAHAQGMVHRDLKPANILFDQNNMPYLADFGIVKLSEAGATLTGNAIVGTPAYMSPEQGRGEADLDGRSDLYSLGVILFEALTGNLPYVADTSMGQILKHISAPIPDILAQRPDLPSDCQKVIQKAMSKRKYTRYPTTLAFAKALSAVAGGMPLPAIDANPTISLPMTGEEFTKPQRQDGSQGPQPRIRPAVLSSPGQTAEPPRQKPKSHRLAWISMLVILLLIGGVGSVFAFPSAFPSVRSSLLSMLESGRSLTGLQATATLQIGDAIPQGQAATHTSSTATPTPGSDSDAAIAPTATPTSLVLPEPTQPVIMPVDGVIASHTFPVAPISAENLDQMVKLATKGTGAFLDIQLSPDGSYLALATTTGVYLYDAAAFDLIQRLPTQFPAVSIAFSPDGNRLAIAEQNNTVVWDMERMQPLYTLPGSNDYIDHVLFSANGKILVSGGKNTYLWQAEDGSPIRTLEGISASTVGISSDGQLLAMPIEAREIQISNVLDGTVLQVLRAYEVSQVSFITEDDIMIATCGDTIRLWESESWNLLDVLDGYQVAISSDGLTLATALSNGTINVWRFGLDGTPSVSLDSYEHDKDGAIDMQLSPEGTYLAYWYTAQVTDDPIAEKYQVKLYRTVDGAALPAHSASQTWISSVVFSPDESRLVSLAAQKAIQFWAAEDRTPLGAIDRSSSDAASISYNVKQTGLESGVLETSSSNGEMTARVAGENIDVFFTKDNSKVRTIYASLAAEADIAFTPDGRTIASISQGDIVRVWNVDDGRQICTVGGTAAFPVMPGVTNIFYSMNGDTLGVYQRDGTLSYWQAGDCQHIDSFHLQNNLLSPDRGLFVEGAGRFPVELTFRMVDDGSELLTIHGPFSQYGFYEGGKLFAAILWDKTLHVWGVLP